MNNKTVLFAAAAMLLTTHAAIAKKPGASLAQPVSFSSLQSRELEQSVLPLDKVFDELSFGEMDLLRNQYALLRNSEEPPYPTGGLQSIVGELNALQAKSGMRGELFAVISVDAAGNARDVSWLMTPEQGSLEEIRSVLLAARFKPAKCGAKACAMEFPLHVDFGSRAL